MSELSKEARALIDTASRDDHPRPEDRARLRAMIAAQTARLPAAEPRAVTTGTGPTAGAASEVAFIAKIATAVIALASGYALLVHARGTEPSTPRPTLVATTPSPAHSPEPSVSSAGLPASVPAVAPLGTDLEAAPPRPMGRIHAESNHSNPEPSLPLIGVRRSPIDFPAPGLELDGQSNREPSTEGREVDRPEPETQAENPELIGASAMPHAAEPSLRTPPDSARPWPRPARRDLEREAQLMGETRIALGKGDAALALRLTDAHAQRFPQGVLLVERLAARAMALCALGRAVEARPPREELAARSPRSALLDRVDRACGGVNPSDE